MKTPNLLAALLVTFTITTRADDFVAHEWGTFTSIQGSDGALLRWTGAEVGDLPSFVHSTSRPGQGRFMFSLFSKTAYEALQRMETPVIYFYSDTAMRADVTVGFPKGIITEWFPQAHDIGPSSPKHVESLSSPADTDIAARELQITNSLIRWRGVEVLPAATNNELAANLPISDKANHYFAARETDSSYLRVDPLEQSELTAEHEKFLFYRGAGNFQTPLQVTISPDDRLTLENTGGDPLKHLFVLTVRGDRAAFRKLDHIDSQQSHSLSIEVETPETRLKNVVVEISRQMADALAAEGLYRAEAEAMVKTWSDTWFEDQGVRLLYVLPRAWTDQLLPIEITPEPRELVRVMVGRSELITPSREAEIRNCITHFKQTDESRRLEAVRRFQEMGLGRFATPAIRFATRNPQDSELRSSGYELLNAARKLSSSSELARN